MTGRTAPRRSARTGGLSNIIERRLAIEAADRALRAAEVDLGAACAGDDRFTSDARTEETTAELAAICQGCPILEQCAAYATAAAPPAGYWAGAWRAMPSARRARRSVAQGGSGATVPEALAAADAEAQQAEQGVCLISEQAESVARAHTRQGISGDRRGDRTQTGSQILRNRPEIAPDRPAWLAPPVSRTAPPEEFRGLVELALEIRCQVCRARPGHYCSGPAHELPRRRIRRELLHPARLDHGALRGEQQAQARRAAASTMRAAAARSRAAVPPITTPTTEETTR